MTAFEGDKKPTLDYAPQPRPSQFLAVVAAIAIGTDLFGIPVAYFFLPAPLSSIIIYVLIVSGTIFGLIYLFVRRLDRIPRLIRSPAIVTFDEETITCRLENGRTETIRWADLDKVVIETTSSGPFVDDIFWVLFTPAAGCVIPSEARGIQPLLDRLQKLPGFDFENASRGMRCTEDRTFVCWKRVRRSESAEAGPRESPAGVP